MDISQSIKHSRANQAVVCFTLSEIKYKYDSLEKNKKELRFWFIRLSNILGMVRFMLYISLIVAF